MKKCVYYLSKSLYRKECFGERQNELVKLDFGEITMREVILCADGDSVVYAVPDEVANNLRKY